MVCDKVDSRAKVSAFFDDLMYRELIQRIQSEIERRNLNEREQKNYNNLKELVNE